VVIKPARDAFAFASAAEACGFPPGVINVITGGRDVGAYLVAHPLVNKVAFTGSTAAGRAIGEICGRLLRPVTLELGGKSAAIVLDDADLAETVRGLSWASLLNNGQTCYLSSRILAPRTRYDEVVDAVADLARSLRVGDPLDPATRVGPLVTQQQRERVEGFITAGRAEGARVVAGGGRPKDLDRGWYIEPTVLADLAPNATPVREEIFGPVLAVLPYDDIDHAVSLANDSDYGLGGTVWTRDVARGLEVARRVEAGAVGVNFFDLDLGAPFGGVKGSGLGRELGRSARPSALIEELVRIRSRSDSDSELGKEVGLVVDHLVLGDLVRLEPPELGELHPDRFAGRRQRAAVGESEILGVGAGHLDEEGCLPAIGGDAMRAVAEVREGSEEPGHPEHHHLRPLLLEPRGVDHARRCQRRLDPFEVVGVHAPEELLDPGGAAGDRRCGALHVTSPLRHCRHRSWERRG